MDPVRACALRQQWLKQWGQEWADGIWELHLDLAAEHKKLIKEMKDAQRAQKFGSPRGRQDPDQINQIRQVEQDGGS